jgi:16S rRNA processing protein RimM
LRKSKPPEKINDINDDDMVVLGRIGAPFGVKGWVHIQSFTENNQNLFNYTIWYLHRNSTKKTSWQSFKLLQWKPHGNAYVALLSECEDRDKASLLTNFEIGIPRSLLPELAEDEHYWMDLVGLSVVNEQGEILGIVDSLFETGANDVLVVYNENEKQQHLLPYIPDDYILKIDRDRKQILVRWDPKWIAS